MKRINRAQFKDLGQFIQCRSAFDQQLRIGQVGFHQAVAAASPFSLNGAAAAAPQDAVASARDAFDRAVRELPRESALWVDVARFRDANADTAGARDAVDHAAHHGGESFAGVGVA